MRRVEAVRDDRELGLNVVSRPVNTYVRPREPRRDKLTTIAESLTRYNPELQKFLGKKAAEKRNFEEAVGADLYRKNPGATAEDIKAMIDRGEVEGFKKLTKHHWNGIVEMRHKALADSIATHMLAWEKTAAIEDSNGNAIPLSQVEDQDAVILAFEKEQQQYIDQTTGGTYDKTLFGEIVQEQINMARNTFIRRQSSARSAQIELEKVQSYSQLLDASYEPYVSEGKLILDAENGARQLAGALWENALFAMNRGLTLNTALKEMTTWLESKMRNVDIDNIYQLADVAKLIPELWNTPELANQLEMSKNQSIYERSRRDWQREYDRSQEVKQQMFDSVDTLAGKYGSYYNIPTQEWESLMRQVGAEGLSDLDSMIHTIGSIVTNAGNTSMSMAPSVFMTYELRARRGKLTRESLFSLSPHLNSAQYDKLHSIIQKSKADGGAGNKRFEQAWSMILPFFGLTSDQIDFSAPGEEIKKIYDGAGALFNELSARIGSLGANATEADVFDVVGQMVEKYKDNFGAIKENPKLINASKPELEKSSKARDARQIIDNIGLKGSTDAKDIKLKIDEAAQKGEVYTPTIAECKQIIKASGTAAKPKALQSQIVKASELMVEYYK